MVPMPSVLEVRASRSSGSLRFETHCAGALVIGRGAIDLV
jgi:hypothetical protein